MLDVNTKPLSKEYQIECREFVEKNYEKIYKIALYLVRGDSERAKDLQHDTIERILSHKVILDFHDGPIAVIKHMMLTKLNHHSRRSKVEKKYECRFELNSSEVFVEQEEKRDEWDEVMGLMKVLTQEEMRLIGAYLEGHTLAQMVAMNVLGREVTPARVHQLIKRAMRKMQKQAQIHLQAGQ